ncbi:MAG: hypothetical protein SNJ77_08650 [Cytophagales bacterium]
MFDLFAKPKERKERGHLANLAALSKVDGKLDAHEMAYLYKIGKKFGFNSNEVERIVDNADINFLAIPEGREDKLNHLMDSLEMLLADGKIEEEELDFVTNFAQKLGFKYEIAGVLVRKMAMEMQLGKTREEVKIKIEPFLMY